jgi:hypothetical protein
VRGLQPGAWRLGKRPQQLGREVWKSRDFCKPCGVGRPHHRRVELVVAAWSDSGARSIVLQELALAASQRVVERFDEFVGVEEPSRSLRLGRQDLFLLHLFDRLVLLDRLLHRCRGFLQHLRKLVHVIQIRERAMPGNDLHVRRQLRRNFIRFRRAEK